MPQPIQGKNKEKPTEKDTEHPSNEQTKPDDPKVRQRKSLRQSRSVDKMPIQNKLNEVMIEGKTTENLFNELAQQRQESQSTLKTDMLKQSESFK